MTRDKHCKFKRNSTTEMKIHEYKILIKKKHETKTTVTDADTESGTVAATEAGGAGGAAAGIEAKENEDGEIETGK